ncbi:hypothetical protein LJC54_02605 [Parabacteroides sp. OttesenSCG-928-J18]|nr:hypothetical protein [Parabacteroides sp. OttesenSCG-928-J18]
MSLKNIQKAVDDFKKLIESSIIEGGAKGKEAMIRSSRPILNIHEAVKKELIEAGVDENFIFPPIGSRTPELKLAGSRKQKDQDVCVVSNLDRKEEILQEGLLKDVVDEFGEEYTEKTIAVNIRSQISSIQKNFDTLYERTTSEAINLHDRCPKMVLGEVYMIAIPEYDDKQVKNNRIAFKKISQTTVLKYIKSFQAINNRKGTEKNFYQYEKTCLLIVDFSKTPAKIYNTSDELKKAGLIPDDSTVDISELSWDKFVPNLLSVYKERFAPISMSK